MRRNRFLLFKLFTAIVILSLSFSSVGVLPGSRALAEDADGLIVFTAPRPAAYGAPGDVYAIRPGAESPIRLTYDLGCEDSPAIAPDGTRLAFARAYLRGGACDYEDGMLAFELLPVDPNAPAMFTIYQPYDVLGNVSWMPDGGHILFTQGGYAAQDVYIIGDGGEFPTRLTTWPGGDNAPKSSPDGTMIAWASNGGNGGYEASDQMIYLMDLDIATHQSSNLRPLLDPAEQPIKGSHLGWSPDGQHLAVSQWVSDSWHVYIVDLINQNHASAPRHLHEGQMPSFSADGSQVVFSIATGTTSNMYIMNSDGTGTATRVGPPDENYDTAWQWWWPTGLSQIQGDVTVPDQSGLPGVELSLGWFATAHTDQSGHYSISALHQGTYVLQPQKPGYCFTPPSRSVTLPAESQAFNFEAAPCDSTPPAAVGDLSAAQGGLSGTINLSWTAPGDDGWAGAARQYDVRYSASPISASNWLSASQLSGEPAPLPAGSGQEMTVTMPFVGQRYYFAIKAADEANNWSGLSNSPSALSGEPADTTPPARITDLKASEGSQAGEVLLTWTAPGDDGNTGTADYYSVGLGDYVWIGKPDVWFDNAGRLRGQPAPAPAGTKQSMVARDSSFVPGNKPYFAIKTFDEADNASVVSNIVSIVIPNQVTPRPDLQVTIQSVNPATVNAGQSVTVNFTVRNAGAAAAAASTAKVFLAAYPSQSAAPKFCNSVSIPALASKEETGLKTCTGTVPAGSDPGTFYLVVQADALDAVVESDENNNRVSQPLVVTGPELHDLRVRGIEITQGIQYYHIEPDGSGLLTEQYTHDPAYGTTFPFEPWRDMGPGKNELRLVKGRNTIVRVYVDVVPPFVYQRDVTVRLNYQLDGIPKQPQEITIPLSGKEGRPRSATSQSFDFLIEGQYLGGNILTVNALVDPDAKFAGDDPSNNDRVESASLNAIKPLRIGFVPVSVVNPALLAATGFGSLEHKADYVNYVKAVLPFTSLLPADPPELSGFIHIANPGSCLISGIAPFELVTALEGLKPFYPELDVIVGVFSEDTYQKCPSFEGIKGVSQWIGYGSTVIVIDNPSSDYSVLAHELGHLLAGLHHPALAEEQAGLCLSYDSDSNWPYDPVDEYEIQEQAAVTLPFSLQGDIWQQRELFNTHPRDIMCYGSNLWASPFTWETWMSKVMVTATPAAQQEAALEGTSYLVVSGLIHNDDTASIDPIFETAQAVFSPPAGTAYCVQAVSGTGTVLSEQCFDLSFYDPERGGAINTEVFQAALPADPLIARVRVTHNGETIEDVEASAHSPTVAVTYPNGGEALNAPFTLAWTGTDADGDALAYEIMYSADSGATWSLLATGLTASSIELDPAILPGTTGGLFKVVASDGLHNAEDQSDAVFSVGPHAPSAYITLPTDASSVLLGKEVTLQGSGYDLEDGDLPDASFAWTSSLDGELGTGKMLSISTLNPGVHKITLTVTDSDAMSTSQSLYLEVLADSDADGMPDGWEAGQGLNPAVDDAGEDPDGDGLTNVEEYQRGTDPKSADTDLDAVDDLTELLRGTDPLAVDATLAISGNAGMAGVTLSYTDGTAQTATSDANGDYSLSVSRGWSGTVTPSLAGHVFTPAAKTYSNVLANQANQDYVPHALVARTYRSAGGCDGTVVETGENTTRGGTADPAGTTFRLGDDAARRQSRAILCFNTQGLPDNAVISSAQLVLRKQSISSPGGNPFTIFQGLMIDVRKGFFGTTAALQPEDFQAAPDKSVGPFLPTPAAGVYTITLPKGAYPYINKLSTNGGTTQMRLRFKLDDNNDTIANVISFFSGNHATGSYRPTLLIKYYAP